MTEDRSHVRTVEKAAAILDLFSIQRPELSMTEVRRELGLPKATSHRLLSTLEAAGLLDRDPTNGYYRLGVKLITLAGQVMVYSDISRIADRHLQVLAEQSTETVNLATLYGYEALNIERQLPPGQQIIDFGWVGRRTSAHAASTGKVLIAWLPEDEIRELMPSPLERFTEHTITDIEELLQHLAKVRLNGYAIGHEEHIPNLNAIAAPVRDYTGKVIAAVSISGPAYRIFPDRFKELGELVCKTADQISVELGYRP